MIAATVAAVATVAVPAPAVLAKQGGHQPHAPKGPKGKCAKLQSVGFAAAGTLASYTADSVTVNVTHANKHARAYIAAAGQTFSLGGARVSFEGVTDADASGTVDFADVLPTDVVRLGGKVSRAKHGCPVAPGALTLRKVRVERPGAADDQSADES
jgi:hypothetical protein